MVETPQAIATTESQATGAEKHTIDIVIDTSALHGKPGQLTLKNVLVPVSFDYLVECLVANGKPS